MFGSEVHVYLGGFDVFVAEVFADGFEVEPGVEAVGGMGVPEQVVVDAPVDAGTICGCGDGFAHVFVGCFGFVVDEEVPLVFDFFKAVFKGLVQAVGGDGYGAPFVAFAEDVEGPGFEVDLLGGELEGFGPPQA